MPGIVPAVGSADAPPRARYANVVSTLALFAALGGGAYAAAALPRNSVGKAQLKANAVTSGKVRDGALRGKDLRRATVTARELAPGAVARVASAAAADRAAAAGTADRATSAAAADRAGSAATADALGGLAPSAFERAGRRFNGSASAGDPVDTVLFRDPATGAELRLATALRFRVANTGTAGTLYLNGLTARDGDVNTAPGFGHYESAVAPGASQLVSYQSLNAEWVSLAITRAGAGIEPVTLWVQCQTTNAGGTAFLACTGTS